MSFPPETLSLTLEHLQLVAITILLASAIGLPLGVLLHQQASLRRVTLGLIDAIQTVPSLALFGLLVPIGIGSGTAIFALVLYALLPIVRNTLAGLGSVPVPVVESAIALGFTRRQLLFQVELPLAARTIFTGIRLATVITIGTATIAAAIGAGGLGVLIYRGIASVDATLLLAGALPAAIMALWAEYGLAWLESKVLRF